MDKDKLLKLLKTLELCQKFLKPESDMIPKGYGGATAGSNLSSIAIGTDASCGLDCRPIFEGEGIYINTDNGVKGYVQQRADGTLYVDGEDKKKKTLADRIREDAQIKAALLEKYWECKKLLKESIEFLKSYTDYGSEGE